MASARLSPTANLLRKSRLFALPPALNPPQDPPTSKAVRESDTATLPYPTRASIVTPRTSLAKGDWGLKRALPAKSTSEKSSRPIVRLNALDTYEHVTDFDSAADHTLTLQKFQELHMPISLPFEMKYATNVMPEHRSPFEQSLDNSETSKRLGEPGVKQYRHTGPWLAGLTEAEFATYLKTVSRRKPELLRQLREQLVEKRIAEARKKAQDNGEDLETLAPPTITEEDFQRYLKTLRANPTEMGPVLFKLLDLSSSPDRPNDRVANTAYEAPGTSLAAIDYAKNGPPRTHPSAGLSYSRSHALIYNHPKYGPQVTQKPVQARILRPKGRFRGRASRAVAGVGGIAVEDLNGMTFHTDMPAGLMSFDASIPGGAKYWASPIRASIDTDGRIRLVSNRASEMAKLPYGIEEYKPAEGTNVSDVARGAHGRVPRLDRTPLNQARWTTPANRPTRQPMKGTEDVARSLVEKLGS
ncbi:hypothetical protein N7474_010887 [Penicillium riverlandense]|uniref:uncharacterized protein n=1 Tax=Penicillium riverlandense TaxID=1903569 RepID=UPI0025466983|nr:uncharacterized protein N7474_010887 [Penicillium riverlandense]KAJ5805000.1 hypothetical protein N7474_010887 [Penicillium riverlandense]